MSVFGVADFQGGLLGQLEVDARGQFGHRGVLARKETVELGMDAVGQRGGLLDQTISLRMLRPTEARSLCERLSVHRVHADHGHYVVGAHMGHTAAAVRVAVNSL